MNEINIDTSKNNYFYYKDPFNDLVGKNKIFKGSEDGGLVLIDNFQGTSESQNKIISAISEFYKCLHKKRKTVTYEDLCFINKELFEKFKPLQTFVFRENNQSQDNLLISIEKEINPIARKINYWTDFRKEWYYWSCLIFIFGELRLYFLEKQLPEHKYVLDNFFSKLKPLRCFYNTMDMLAPKDFRAENISVNDLLLNRKDIFKFKIITPQKNGIIEKGTVNSVCQTKFDGKNYRYKKMNVFEKVPRISTDDTENDKKLTNRQKQNFIMGNYSGAKENDARAADVIFENIIPTEIGFLLDEGNDLEPVCLMEEAEGKIGYRIFLHYDEYTKATAENFTQHYDAELVDASNPDLQIEALKLAIVDVIGLILDRNAGNMFFRKTKVGKFKFVGIDNDWVCSLEPNSWYKRNLNNFFEAKVPFITSELKEKVLAKLSDGEIKKLLYRLEGKINRGPGGEEVIEALQSRMNDFKDYIGRCEVVDELNDKTAEKFMKQSYPTTDNPISAMTPVIQMLHSEQLLEQNKNQSTENHKPTTRITGKKIIDI